MMSRIVERFTGLRVGSGQRGREIEGVGRSKHQPATSHARMKAKKRWLNRVYILLNKFVQIEKCGIYSAKFEGLSYTCVVTSASYYYIQVNKNPMNFKKEEYRDGIKRKGDKVGMRYST